MPAAAQGRTLKGSRQELGHQLRFTLGGTGVRTRRSLRRRRRLLCERKLLSNVACAHPKLLQNKGGTPIKGVPTTFALGTRRLLPEIRQTFVLSVNRLPNLFKHPEVVLAKHLADVGIAIPTVSQSSDDVEDLGVRAESVGEPLARSRVRG